jgi:hypothetical protein
MRLLLTSLALVALFFGDDLPLRAGAILDAIPTDDNVIASGVGDGEVVHLYTLQAGTNFGGNTNIVEAFALPYLAPGQTITAATISFYLNAQVPTPASSPNYNLSLYGLNRVSLTNSLALASDYYIGTTDSANTLLTTSFVTPSNPLNSVVSYSGANLTAFINTQRANPLFTGQDLSTTRYIFFRLNANSDVENNGVCNYEFGSGRNPNRTQHPMLALTISGGISNLAGRMQFSFNLPVDSTTSAGVYNTTTGVLMRTLWNNQRFQAGTNYGSWDGKDDNGVSLPTGTNYQIKMIYHNVQYVWEGMVGNTSTAQSGANVYRSFDKMHDMTVSGGQAYYTVGYNELGAPFHSFTVGAPQVPSALNFSYNLCDPYSALYYVTADATRTYWAKVYGGIPPPGSAAGTVTGVGTFIIAINKADNSFYTFPKGTSMTKGSFQIYPSGCDYDGALNEPNAATGLAVQQTGNELFVSHKNLNLVRVFDKVQGNLLGSFTVASPGRMACTANGDLWVISNGSSPTVLRYTVTNGSAVLDKTLSGFSAPAGLGVSADDSLLLVTDGGASQQIKAYANSTGASAWTYGTLGGMPANGPTVSTSCFDFNTQEANLTNMSNEAFVAFQADNSFWVEDGGNGRILHYSISGNTPIYIEQISFVDASYRSTVDLTDPTRVFNNFIEYAVDYTKPLGGTNGSWKIAKNWIVGLPSDATHNYVGFANGFINVVTMPNGRAYGFLSNFNNNNSTDLFELSQNGPARFTGYSFPGSTNPLIYADCTLRYNVVNGAATTIAYYSQPLTGFDANNNPVWGSPTTLASATLNPAVDPIPWNAFPIRTEVTASGGVVDFGANSANTGYHLGCLKIGTSNWQWEASKSINGPYWFPQDGQFDIGNNVQYAGNYALAVGRNIVYGYHGELWKNGEASQWVNFLDNGLMVGLFGTFADAGVASVSTNGYSGNSFSPALVRGPNGTVFLYHNDENNHAGSVRWEIKGWDGITELNGTGAVGSTVALSPITTGPTISLTSPTPGAAYLNGSAVNLSAEAASSGAAVSTVQFFDGSTSLGTDTTAPFNLNATGLTPGSHVITAKATDASGISATSAPITITVGSDGTTAPPAAPASLSSSNVSAQSVSLSWTQPAIGTTSSTIGQIMSFQFDKPGDANALKPSDVAGVAPYAATNWNLLGQTENAGLTFTNVVNNSGTTIANLGENLGIGGSSSTNSTQSLIGTVAKLFSTEVTTTFNTAVGVGISSIPYASYDVVVYGLPAGISGGTQTSTVTVNNATTASVIKQTFNKLNTTYTTATVPFGSSPSTALVNVNTVVVQGLTGPAVEIQGANIAGFQIVERPYDQGTPTSYQIQRASGTSGSFATIGTASSSATTFTDTSSLSPSTTYQYRIEAVNSYGTSAASNVVTVTTPAASVAATTSFAAWQSQYFTAEQLADPTISGPTADPYGSGVPNLLAYALQLNPATVRPTDVPSPVITNGHLTVTYFVPNSISDISYIVEVSSDLQTWNSGSGYTSIVTSVPGSSGTTITVQDQLPATTQKHFMRLRVTQNP